MEEFQIIQIRYRLLTIVNETKMLKREKKNICLFLP